MSSSSSSSYLGFPLAFQIFPFSRFSADHPGGGSFQSLINLGD